MKTRHVNILPVFVFFVSQYAVAFNVLINCFGI